MLVPSIMLAVIVVSAMFSRRLEVVGSDCIRKDEASFRTVFE
jgi:hypothetical protein